MSAPVVAIGYIILIPCVLGMLFGALMLFATGNASGTVMTQRQEAIRSELLSAGVPDAAVNEISEQGTLSSSTRGSLTDEQRRATDSAIALHAGAKIGAGAATAIAGGFSIFVIVTSFVGGLLGWLLVMKKKVLQCNACETVIAAS